MFTPGIISIVVVVVVVVMSEFLLCTEAQKNTHTHTRWGSDESCFFARARRDNHFPLCVWWKFKI